MNNSEVGFTTRFGMRHDVISKIAYELWEKDNRPSGKDLEFWLLAETEYSEKQVLLKTFENKVERSKDIFFAPPTETVTFVGNLHKYE